MEKNQDQMLSKLLVQMQRVCEILPTERVLTALDNCDNLRL